MSTLQKSIRQGINLRGTIHAGKSAAALRQSSPGLARRWARFIETNKGALVAEIAGRLVSK